MVNAAMIASRRVYPRVCGGTPCRVACVPSLPGLSPRVRGNLNVTPSQVDTMGSIPACAGEPGSVRRRWGIIRVYPRVCGGTGDKIKTLLRTRGLSPRVRGNRVLDRDGRRRRRSIPACAGEPAPPTGWD